MKLQRQLQIQYQIDYLVEADTKIPKMQLAKQE